TTTGSTTIDSVFSTAVKARGAWSNAYFRCLSQGLPYRNDWNSMIQEAVSGTLTYGHGWSMSRNIIINGMNSTSTNEDMEGYISNFTYIRQAYLVIENIDKVKDMTGEEKAVVKAEMKALIAYRYAQMLIMYGGVPIISGSLNADGDLALPRKPAKDVLDSVVNWCDQAIAVLPSVWEDTWKGRMTKSAALAIKSKVLLYAARPLFNSAAPYLGFAGNNELICFGSADANRWNTAAAAAEALITEAETNGGAFIINTGNPIEDYGVATSRPGNAEVLLAFKLANTSGDNGDWNTYPMTAWYYPRINGTNVAAAAFTCTYSHLINYYKQDGTEQTWPAQNVMTPFSDYLARMNEMEPRFKADFKPYQMAAWNNPGDNNWNATSVGLGYSNGAATSVKFYYKAGTRRWFEFPVFRLAAAYLSAAEAYNEMG
ncbi:MAG: RagB/SusD family nutrient uptake outer membrane protein, partial [Sphingobacteriales bacterium]